MENRIDFFGYSVFSGSLNTLSFSQKTLISTLNQYSFCIAEQDHEFKKALQDSDILLPDGMAIVKAVKLIKGKKIKKIAGADIHEFLLNQLNKKAGKCFYLGSSENTLKKIKNKIATEFPEIKVQTYSPHFKKEFSNTDIENMLEAINVFQPDVLFVGMTAPKQEKWAYSHKEKINAKIICSIGAVFDFYAGTVQRPHPVWINLGLEWFIRLIKEPKRMWKRYLYYGPVFLKLILEKKINIKSSGEKV